MDDRRRRKRRTRAPAAANVAQPAASGVDDAPDLQTRVFIPPHTDQGALRVGRDRESLQLHRIERQVARELETLQALGRQTLRRKARRRSKDGAKRYRTLLLSQQASLVAR